MAIVLYDLAGADDRRFSTNCWRTRFALAHKGLACEAVPTRFTEIAGIGDGSHRTIPVIEDAGRRIGDSWAIAEYLEEAYPDRPSVFGGAAGKAYARFVQDWCESRISPLAVTLIVVDIHDHLDPADRAHFRQTRLERFGRPIEEVQAGREDRIPEFRARLEPIRRAVAHAPFLGGAAPHYADYLAVAPLIWARKVSPLPLVERDDPVHAWMGRCLDLYDGLARHGAGYDW